MLLCLFLWDASCSCKCRSGSFRAPHAPRLQFPLVNSMQPCCAVERARLPVIPFTLHGSSCSQ